MKLKENWKSVNPDEIIRWLVITIKLIKETHLEKKVNQF